MKPGLSHSDMQKVFSAGLQVNLNSPLLSAITKFVLVTLRGALWEKKIEKSDFTIFPKSVVK